MKTKVTLVGVVLACFGTAALLVLSGGVLAVVVIAAGLVVAAAGAYRQEKARDEVRTAAVQYLEQATGSGDTALQELRRRLSRLRFENHLEKDAARALAQLDLAEQRFRGFEAALRTRLNPGEMTFDRYVGAGRQVLDAVVSGLSEVAGLMPELQSQRAGSGGRRQLPRGAERRLEEVFGGNDRALRELEAAHAAVAKWQGGPEMSRELGRRLEESLEELRDLSRQAGKYR